MLRATVLVPLVLSLAALFPHGVLSSFQYSLSTAFQCGNLTVTVSGGQGPYELLLIPLGETTNGPEIRRIVDRNISAGVTTDTFQLKFPTSSKFLPVMSDSTGFNTGGTGVSTTVAASEDASCLPTEQVSPDFFFNMAPNGVLTQCGFTNFTFNGSQIYPVTLYGLIPGGESFQIPVPDNAALVNWQNPARAGTSVQILGGDSRGKNTGGSTDLLVVQPGASGCINAQSPSSTAGSPAGSLTASSQTATSTSSATSGTPTTTTPPQQSGKKSNTGAIAGGVVGGVAGLTLVGLFLFFYICRRKKETKPDHSNVDLMTGEDPDRSSGGAGGPPMIQAGFYQPEPFVVPEPGSSTGRPSSDQNHATSGRASSSVDISRHSAAGGPGSAAAASSVPTSSRSRRQSQQSMGQVSASTDPTSHLSPRTGTRGDRSSKSHPPSALRATNYGDAGGSDIPAQDEEQVVELPPTYASVRKPGDA